jgi:hypothetical protein
MNLRIASVIALLLALASGRAAATELIVCNKGTIPVYAATATHESEFLISRVWHIVGWYEIRRGACSSLYDDDEPFYFAFSFKDSSGDWGAARFTPDRDSMWRNASENLCLARGALDYKRGGGDPAGPCKDGYFRFPGTLVFYPDSDYASFTLNVSLDERDRAYPVDLQPLEAVDPDASDDAAPLAEQPVASAATPTIFDKLLEAAAEGLKQGIEDAVEHGLTDPSPAPSSAPGSAIGPSQPSPTSSTPTPAERAMSAKLFGEEISRRAYSGSPWFNSDGSSVEVFYDLDGKTYSELFDAPTQRAADDPDVRAALATLNRGLASIAGNREARITSEGRLKYDFETQGGNLARYWVNIEALDFSRGRVLTDRVGYTGFGIPCNRDERCVITVDQDDTGKQSNHDILNVFQVLFATEQDGRDVWAALQQLRALYPAPPVVTAR